MYGLYCQKRIANMILAMTTVALDRFGRIVIPRSVRQRHGWRPGMLLELHDSSEQLSIVTTKQSDADVPLGWAWVDGMLIATAQATGDVSDIKAIRDRLDAERDCDLQGIGKGPLA